MANICFVSLKIECRSKRAALKVNAVLTQLKEAADQQRKGFYAGSDRYIFDAAFYVYEKEVSMVYWVKWGYQDAEVIALIKFLNEITPIKSLLLRYEEGGSLEYGEYIYSAGTLSCRDFLFRIIPMQPTATPIRNSCNRHLSNMEQQERFHFYNTSRKMK